MEVSSADEQACVRPEGAGLADASAVGRDPADPSEPARRSDRSLRSLRSDRSPRTAQGGSSVRQTRTPAPPVAAAAC